jgi:hypothetical protein
VTAARRQKAISGQMFKLTKKGVEKTLYTFAQCENPNGI